MSKENLVQRIAFQKQQIINAQNAEAQRIEVERLVAEKNQKISRRK